MSKLNKIKIILIIILFELLIICAIGAKQIQSVNKLEKSVNGLYK